jgi:hypothetical protein
MIKIYVIQESHSQVLENPGVLLTSHSLMIVSDHCEIVWYMLTRRLEFFSTRWPTLKKALRRCGNSGPRIEPSELKGWHHLRYSRGGVFFLWQQLQRPSLSSDRNFRRTHLHLNLPLNTSWRRHMPTTESGRLIK